MTVQARLVANAGTLVTCPNCHSRIGTLLKPLYDNFTFGLDRIRFEKNQRPEHGKAVCRRCGDSYCMTHHSVTRGVLLQVHTEQGWLPPSMEPQAVPHRVIQMR